MKTYAPSRRKPAKSAGPYAGIMADANGAIIDKQLRRNPETGGARLELHVRRIDETKPIELRAALRNDNEASETWSYALPPG